MGRISFCLILLAAALSSIMGLAAESKEGGDVSKAPKRGILLVSFGTTTENGEKAYRAIEKAFRAAFPDDDIRMAYTSGIVRKRLAQKGKSVPSVSEALEGMAKDGVGRVVAQSLHVVAGEEFHDMARDVRAFRPSAGAAFQQIDIGRPLIVSCGDLRIVADAVVKSLPKGRGAADAVLFMGHGQAAGRCDMAYAAADAELRKRDSKLFLATVEGGMTFEEALSHIKESAAKKVWLRPFLIVAGDHAANDLLGDEADSWKSRLLKEGFACEGELLGLGEIPAVAELFVQHARKAKERPAK